MFFIIWREDCFGGFFLMEVEFVVCWSGRVFFYMVEKGCFEGVGFFFISGESLL